MASRWCRWQGCFLALALSVLTTAGMGATREAPERNPLSHNCAVQTCSPGCPCIFDMWQDARLLKFGYGMTADQEAAAYWYRRAAEKGDARAAFNYGLMLIHGIGTEADPIEGLRLINVAASASVQEAWFELGNLHRQGDHVAIDLHAAIEAYRRAADRGHVRAQYALGNMYGNGQGAGVDLVTAYKWWRLAARKGHELAERSLSLVTSMMTPGEISLGKRAVDDWLSTVRKR